MNVSGYEAQTVLFAARPSRLALQQLEFEGDHSRVIRINVWRNHAIESVVTATIPYMARVGCIADFCLSDYDDTLMFEGHRQSDLELVWVDSGRYLKSTPFADWAGWFAGRITALRSVSSAPVIVATWWADAAQEAELMARLDTVPGVFLADLQASCNEANTKLTDSRTAALAGTPLSNAAQLVVARKLACHWIPAAIWPPIKVVAVDLDNTLHSGVLGEDGLEGVSLTPAHQALQRFLKAQRERGVFLALVSRNEASDVQRLFTAREDYPLRWEDFSATEISWGDKAEGLSRIAKALRVAPDSMLFVDDNPGELASVVSRLPQVHTVYAGSDPAETQRAIEYYPGLWRWKIERDDTKRIEDLKANAEREQLLAETVNPSEYFKNLCVSIVLRVNPSDLLGRLSDLCGKTNQFNLALRRFNQAELAARLGHADDCIVSMQLTDRLSDSGVIGVVVAHREGERLIIEELCVSCRAMGRHLEDALIVPAICQMPCFAGCREVAFHVGHGSRNQPALDWLARIADVNGRPVPGSCAVDADRLRQFPRPLGITYVQD